MPTSTIDEIFWEAAQLASPTERDAYLHHACSGDAALRRQVESLLAASSRADHFLETPAIHQLGAGFAEIPEGETGSFPASQELDESLHCLEPSDKPGSIGRLGHYEVQEVVGRGGMGIVFKAFDERLHRIVAIKVMAGQLAISATARKRFIREARAAAAVTHDHIVTIHAVEDTAPLPYIVMQYVAGASLQDRLDRTGPLQLNEILRIGMQTASGLAAAHAQGLVHRDVKPANILLENGIERVKLTDFGLARAAEDAALTQSGTVAGTPLFMSPEQAEDRSIDHRSDLFSLGSVLYAISTGRPPFRASTNIGVLKRVCEDTPAPIRDTNPELPEWLAAAIEKLHAKDPAARFQSAAEVAELFARQLAHVQHPSVVPLPAVAKSADAAAAAARPAGHRRWTLAAAVLVATFAVLGTTEATGVTSVRATVTRVLTPDGTLIVETDDPNVKVTVEDDGGLVVNGAGLQEIRLKPGSYRVFADRDGQRVPLDRELVTVSRHGREIVRVKLEVSGAPPVAKAGMGAFVLLAAGKQRNFNTLAEALTTSTDDDTIEIRGNGPFAIDHTEIKHALTIRAGAGFRPVLTAAPQEQLSYGSLVISHGPLRLEGLEFRCTPKAYRILHANGPLWAANCRIQYVTPGWVCIETFSSCDIRNCEMQGGASLAVRCHSEGHADVSNCIMVGHINLEEFDSTRGASVRFSGNTIVSQNSTFLHCLHEEKAPLPLITTQAAKQVHLTATENVFDSISGAFALVVPEELAAQFGAADAEAWIPRRMSWREERNLYHLVKPYIRCEVFLRGAVPLKCGKDLVDWNRFWGVKDTGSSVGLVRFHGGDLNAKAMVDSTKFTPDDFRLRSDSAGYRAGKDKKDLGADVDRVGPGEAYERWKRTPEYQQWLKESGQLKK